MRNTAVIAWKEIVIYFTSPIAYIVGLAFLAVTGFFFVDSISITLPEATARGYLGHIMVLTFVAVWSPLITMRLLAEEQKLGTLELLLTSPVRDWEIVLGKYLASLSIYAVTVALTLYYVLLLFWFGDPDTGPLLTGYLGFLLYGAAALAVGLLASSLTANQIVAAVVGSSVLLILTFVDRVSDYITGLPGEVLTNLALTNHYLDFLRGILDTNHLVYFVSLTAAFLFLAVRSLESRRWR